MLCVSQGKITHSKAPSNYLKKIEAVLYKRVISDPKWGFFPSNQANLTLPSVTSSLWGQ
jgi:hypothetical protein